MIDSNKITIPTLDIIIYKISHTPQKKKKQKFTVKLQGKKKLTIKLPILMKIYYDASFCIVISLSEVTNLRNTLRLWPTLS